MRMYRKVIPLCEYFSYLFTVQYTLVKPKVKGVELDEDMPDDEL